MTGSEIRTLFLDYFKSKGHMEVSSSSLIPKDDPTLLFVNAGMVQFKNVFLGTEKRDYKRAVSSQKCVRAGGKHNDLDNVGYTSRHHTFFEMLGNFSFGDYFKKEVIEFGWELITSVYGIAEDKLWVTVFKEDDEAYDLWKNHIGISDGRLVKMGESDNFWSMADTGPCGPCSEIIVDQGERFGCGKKDCKVGCDCDRYLEIWNLVFMQFYRDDAGNLTRLPNPSIDTGMGLERIAAVLQAVKSNYETDLLLEIIEDISAFCGTEYKRGTSESDISMRVIADHSRAVNFLISDGVFPSNEGRGYVLRRILRRAVRHAKMLGVDKPFLYKTLPSVNRIFGDVYPELIKRADFVSRVVRTEEERFLETIDRGLELLETEVAELQESSILSGKVAFRLYDTYGFPYDLTEDITKSKGIKIDSAEFNLAMKKQREQSRQSLRKTDEGFTAGLYGDFVAGGLSVDFTGYEQLEGQALIMMIINNNQAVDSASEGDLVELITDSTPFYGESGGQIGDKGRIESGRFKGEVVDTKKPFTDLIVHKVKIKRGTVWVGDRVSLIVDKDFRSGVSAHHTSTHILHATLKEILGDHVNQAGSLVTPDRLRFDFSHYSGIESKDLRKIEELMNERVRTDDAVEVRSNIPYDEAIKDGATAIFEEKYGDKVRIVSIGDYSKELCGGTHLCSSGESGFIKVISEAASSAGVRRIEAVASESAVKLFHYYNKIIENVRSELQVPHSQLIKGLKMVVDENESLVKKLKKFKDRTFYNEVESFIKNVKKVNGIKLLIQDIEGASATDLRTVWDSVKPKICSGVTVLASKNSEKVFLLVGVTEDLLEKYHAGNIVRELSRIVGGKGGGKPDLAQGGGSITCKMNEALAAAGEIIEGTF